MPRYLAFILTVFFLFLILAYKKNYQTINDYQLSKQIEVEGLKNLSGVTFCKDSGTLWLINNAPAEILELSLEGKVLRKINLKGIYDTEDIAWLEGSIFAIADEYKGRIIIFDIPATVKCLSMDNAISTWKAPDTFKKNRSLESLAYNKATQTFLSASEKYPIKCYEVFYQDNNLKGKEVLKNLKLEERVEDISGATFFQNNTYILSDDSKRILQIDPLANNITGVISLESGYNGLRSEIEQPEGICFTDDNLVIVSEPNHLYFFTGKYQKLNPAPINSLPK